MTLIKEYFAVVRKNRRVYLPKEFHEGEPVKIIVERITN